MAMAGLMAACLLAVTRPAGHLPHLAARPVAARAVAPRGSLSPRDEGGLLQELPSKPLVRAVQQSGGRVSAADVAAAAGLDLLETRRAMLVLARLVGSDLQVALDGEILFVFGDDVAGQLRRASFKARAQEVWGTASVPLMWLLRASFGVALLSSLTIAVTAIAAASASRTSDNDSSSVVSLSRLPMRVWGPHPLDVFYYSRYSSYGPAEGELGFLQSCFSFLFGDGDPNADLRQRSLRAAAALIRAEGGAVTAEQLAPLFSPAGLPPAALPADTISVGGGAISVEPTLVSEGWVTEALVGLGGEPIVTEDGDIVYIFPELMKTAGSASLPRGVAAAGGALAADTGGGRLAVWEALAWPDAPRSWRPRLGEEVVIAEIDSKRLDDARRRGGRYARELESLRLLVGMQGTVVSDDRDGVPFRVSISSGSQDTTEAFFSLRELRPLPATSPITVTTPFGSAPASNVPALRELPVRFSTAPPGQLAAAGALGAANLLAVAYLGALLRTARASAGYAVPAALTALYPPLLAYAIGFIALPAARAIHVRRLNRGIERRNRLRSAWASALASPPADALRRKLNAARRIRPGVRAVRERDIVLTSAEPTGAATRGAAPPSLDGFDRKLAAREASGATEAVRPRPGDVRGE